MHQENVSGNPADPRSSRPVADERGENGESTRHLLKHERSDTS